MSASWIELLNESDSRIHKEGMIERALIGAKLGNITDQRFLGLVKACYSPFITFGVRQVPTATESAQGANEYENPWDEYNQLLIQLSLRQLTGNAARDAINSMMNRFDPHEWNTFCAPVIRKDLRAGISDKTINKVCKGTDYEIPTFGCQLAASCEDRPEMRGKKRLEVKLDGVRMLLQVIPGDDGEVSTVAYSRNGKVFDNFTHIEQQFIDNFSKLIRSHGLSLGQGFVMDGEVMGQSFQQLMRQARRKHDADATDSVYHVFDIIPLADFRRGYWNAQQRKRLEILDKMAPIIEEMPNVTLVPHITVDLDTGEGRDQFRRYCNDKVEEGFEGVMVKELEAPYSCRRSTSWLKFKPVITVDLEVIDVEEGTGRNVGRLGALVCSGIDGGRQIVVNCGSGFSDGDRDDFWNNSNMVIGRIAEVMADAVTQNRDGTYSLRFPRFVRFRDALTGMKE
jgi:DNA ligase-1